jgi:hypothetical protein
MQKIQILFPDPVMKSLRRLAEVEDRPVSEIVRRAVDRELEQRAGLVARNKQAPPAFPTFDGGRVLTSAEDLRSVLYDEAP